MANGRYNLIPNKDFKIRTIIKSLETSPIRKIANTAIGKKDIIIGNKYKKIGYN